MYILVLKHQAISIHSADQIRIVLDQFQKKKKQKTHVYQTL